MIFHELEIKKVSPNTKNAVLVEFSIPEYLTDNFKFKAGQHIAFEFNIERNIYKRTYSICNSPHENMLCISVKRQQKGIISNYINDAFFTGFRVKVSEPFGDLFTENQVINAANIVLWAGGSGITPILSIAKHILKEFTDKKVTLIYANNNQNSIMFKDEIDELGLKNKGKFEAIHVLSNNIMEETMWAKIFKFNKPKKEWNGLKGYIDGDLIKKIASTNINAVHYICGPDKMMETCETTLKNLNSKSIYMESFGSANSIENTKANSKVKIILDNRKHEILTSKNTLLDAMLEAKLNPPYACKSGTCGSCKAKLISGEVIMSRDFALNEADKEAGKILCCQAWAMTDEIEIIF
jgi:ring-1,2-phenylacetyl-CoA epoxidase subunit PaaE